MLAALRYDLMLAGFSGGELHGIASTSLCHVGCIAL
jgi:hypothetical protein